MLRRAGSAHMARGKEADMNDSTGVCLNNDRLRTLLFRVDTMARATGPEA